MGILLALGLVFGNGAHGALFDRVVGHVAQSAAYRAADKVISLKYSGDDADDDSDSDSDDDTDTATPAVPPVPPVPPVPARPGVHISRNGIQLDIDSDNEGDSTPAKPITIEAKGVATLDALHKIAQSGGWSMTLVGSPKEKVDLSIKNQEPRAALKAVLQSSGAMGVLKGDKLVVVATPDASSAGMLIEKTDGSRHSSRSARHGKHGGVDVVRVFQGDVTIEEGRVVQGDVICVGGSVEVMPGAVVQGDAVSVGGSVQVHQGALVMGEAVAVLGSVDVDRGGQVIGEHVNVGMGKPWRSSSSRHRAWLTGLGPFGLFPTLALFALIYLVGLLVLRMWPERVRNVGHSMFENPVRSFTVGFLCWLLLLPLAVLLCISIVGIPLILLLPVAIFMSIVMGLSSFALRIGEALPAGPGQRFVPPAALGMGMTVLLLLAFVPWLGASILALLQFFALGAAVSSRFGRPALPPHA
jgi:uncharacterized membrane protein